MESACTAFFRSLSALASQARITVRTALGVGIQHFPLSGCWPFDRSDDLFSPGKILRARDDYVLGHEDVVNRHSYLQSLVAGAALIAHHHKQVHIAIGPGINPR